MPCQLAILAQPKAGRNQMLGWQGAELKIKLAAPPVDGTANQEMLAWLGRLLGVRGIRLIKGQTSRHKLLEVPLKQGELKARIDKLINQGD